MSPLPKQNKEIASNLSTIFVSSYDAIIVVIVTVAK